MNLYMKAVQPTSLKLFESYQCILFIKLSLFLPKKVEKKLNRKPDTGFIQ